MRPELRAPRIGLLCGLLCLLPGLGGCRQWTKCAADSQVYSILERKRQCVPDVAGTLNIEAQTRLAEAARTCSIFELDLASALGLGIVASRDYRTQRENVYLTALTLTGVRHDFDPIFGTGANADLLTDGSGTSVGGAVDGSVTKALKTGGSFVLAFALDFLKSLTGDPLNTAQSILDADLVVPLARGSGRLVTTNALTQAEHDTVYALRDFALFQQQFFVDIATRFYRALELQKVWENEELTYESLKLLVTEQSEKAKAGTVPEFEVDQARQDFLRTDDRRQRARASYEDALDRLKFELGIPIGVAVELEAGDLDALLAAEEPRSARTLDECVTTALDRRLDLKNRTDEEQDALREVLVARDGLRGQVDFLAGGALTTPGTQPLNFKDVTAAGSLGLDIDLPLERMRERNDYVRAIVTAERAHRGLQQTHDSIVLEVRGSHRSLNQARRSFVIQQDGVRLAERRVESTEILLQQGGATIRDRLDAEEARVNALNAFTRAVVDRALAKLELERDMGTLRVDGITPWSETASCFPDPKPAPDAAAAPQPASDAALGASGPLGPPPAGLPPNR